MNVNNDSWKIESLPFVFGVVPLPHNGNGLPDALPFELSIDPRTGLLIQVPKPEIKKALENAYKSGSVMCSNFGEVGIGRSYADDFLHFIGRRASHALSGVSVLEIGCGGGYLLNCLRDRGANVLGVEPGDHGQIGAKNYGVEIIQDYFPTKKISKKFSLILLSSVLEHVEEPIELLKVLSEYLEDDGRILVSVPNVAPYIEFGDVSPLFHEHWSYFDSRTLQNTIRLAGYAIDSCEESSFGGSLYAAFRKDTSTSEQLVSELDKAIVRARHYMQSAELNCERLRSYCAGVISSGKTLGIYVPFRFVNFFVIAGLEATSVRFFDDDPNAHGKYYPGIDIPIENKQDLLAHPTDVVLIMSHTFGPRLAAPLKEELHKASIVSIVEIL